MKTILVDRGYSDKLIRIVVPTTNKERMALECFKHDYIDDNVFAWGWLSNEMATAYARASNYEILDDYDLYEFTEMCHGTIPSNYEALLAYLYSKKRYRKVRQLKQKYKSYFADKK